MLGSPGQGHLVPPMGPRQGVVVCSLASEMPKWEAKLALSEGRKQQCDTFSRGAGPPRIRAPWKKNANFGP